MITLRHISKTFHQSGRKSAAVVNALDDVSLEVAAGEICGVVGESGAGKSTLIRCVNLLERPTQGEVIVDGMALTGLGSRELLRARHNIGMIFQHFNLLSSRTVADNIAFPLELIGTPKVDIQEKVARLLELTGLSEKAKQFPAQLSGGQKQRVAIARALASDPKVLLCDEATSALDPKTTESILTLLREINRKLGVTILLITHEMEVVKKICDRVGLLDQGRLVEFASVEEFFTRPQSTLGKKFIAQIQQFELPEIYQARLKDAGAYPVIRLRFSGEEIDQPVLSMLAKRFDLEVNLIQAKVEAIRSTTLGLLIAELIGARDNTTQALAHLATLPLETEVLGYVG